jgi:hypothetical protein
MIVPDAGLYITTWVSDGDGDGDGGEALLVGGVEETGAESEGTAEGDDFGVAGL